MSHDEKGYTKLMYIFNQNMLFYFARTTNHIDILTGNSLGKMVALLPTHNLSDIVICTQTSISKPV